MFVGTIVSIAIGELRDGSTVGSLHKDGMEDGFSLSTIDGMEDGFSLGTIDGMEDGFSLGTKDDD